MYGSVRGSRPRLRGFVTEARAVRRRRFHPSFDVTTPRPPIDRRFAWLWAAFAISTVGTWLAFDAFPLIAILVLDAGPAQVALLAAAGRAVGALVAVPLGPWVEFRRKRPVMVAMDLVRFAALLSVPAAFALGAAQLRPAARRVGRRRRGRHRLPGRERRVPEGARAAASTCWSPTRASSRRPGPRRRSARRSAAPRSGCSAR